MKEKLLATIGLVLLIAAVIVPMCFIRIDLANWPFGDNEDVLLIAVAGASVLCVFLAAGAIGLIICWCKAVAWCWNKSGLGD